MFQNFLQKMGAAENCTACYIMASAGEKVNGVVAGFFGSPASRSKRNPTAGSSRAGIFFSPL
jgi:hypothetical protein